MNMKSREAEKEVNVLQMKIQEVNNNLSKQRKDMDCEYCFTSKNEVLLMFIPWIS